MYRYRKPIKTVVLDLAGTIIDPYVIAPTIAFKRAFKENGIKISNIIARGPMGAHKLDHIRQIMRQLSAEELDNEGELTQKIYRDYTKLQIELLQDKKYTAAIKNVLPAIDYMISEQNIDFATTSGYTRAIQVPILEALKEQGFYPKVTVASDEIRKSRPYGHGIWKVMSELDVEHPLGVINVGDTPNDIQSGLNAGVISVGVARYNNYIGENAPECLNTAEEIDTYVMMLKNELLIDSRRSLEKAGAHYVIDTLAELPLLIERINRERLMSK